MVSVSIETPDQTEDRLRAVIAAADLVVHPGLWEFEEAPLSAPLTVRADALAVVRDADTWCQLIPSRNGGSDRERFGLFSFHFPAGMDNSGFVGWLATHLKRGLGTGVFVICGSNTGRGGIYDYWGTPADLFSDAVDVVNGLRTAPGQA